MDDHTSEPHRRMRAISSPRSPTWRFSSLGIFVFFCLVLPTLAHAGCKVQTLELPVKMVGSRAVATVGINGVAVPLMVDSGAFFSFLTDATAAQLQLRLSPAPSWLRVEGATGRVDARMTTINKLQLLKGDVSRVDFLVGGNEIGAGTMGVMGRNLLSFTDTEYDLAHGAIRFVYPSDDCDKSNMAYWAGSTPVTEIDLVREYRSKLPAIRVPVKLNGHELVALLDSGAPTIVTAQAARRAGVTEADMTPAGTMNGAGRGSAKMWTAAFEKLELGGETITRNRLPVADFDMSDAEMLLGIDFFLSHRIYVSKSQSKVFFTYSGGPVFALNKGQAASAAAFDADPAASAAELASADQFARRGAASAARHDYEQALADLNRACELDPTSAEYLAQRGVVQQALKHPAKALEDFDKALALDPAQADSRFQRAWLRFVAKDRDGAKADLDALDQMLAPQAQMRLAMSRIYLDLDQPAQSLAQLNQWLPAHPKELKRDAALNSRCWARLRLGVELDKALDDCDDAVDSDSKNPVYLANRGWVHLRLGKNKNALSDFDRSIELRPGNAWTLYGRGLAKTRLGDAAQGDADLVAARTLQADIDRNIAQAGLTTERASKP